MYFISLNKLKNELVEKPFSESQTLPYLIGWGLISTLAVEVVSLMLFFPEESSSNTPYNIWDFLTTVLYIAAAVTGPIWLYRKNKGNQGQHFTQRFLAIGWVTSTQFVIASLVAIILFFLVSNLNNLSEGSTQFTFLFETAALSLYYWYTGKHIAEVAEKATYH